MTKTKLLRIASVVAAPFLVLGASSSAFAYSGDQWVDLVDSGSPVGISASMYHVDNGDKFRVYDFHADGHGVRGYLQVLDINGSWTQLHTSYNGKGAGKYTEFSRDVVSKFNYRMKVCTFDGIEDTSPVRCSKWYTFSE
ncbi:hypothetical protein ACFUJY_21285 [Streptomyces sp. NPDC057249]|uniref:hypothetical protein n=1 Tax=Streptomyces sp. NPDC057249 TaxID=3346067 RepID=UPI00363776CA